MRHRIFIVMLVMPFFIPMPAKAMDALFSGRTNTVLDCLDPNGLIDCLTEGVPEKPKHRIYYTGPRYTSQINAYNQRGPSVHLKLEKPPRTFRDKRVK